MLRDRRGGTVIGKGVPIEVKVEVVQRAEKHVTQSVIAGNSVNPPTTLAVIQNGDIIRMTQPIQ